VVGGLGSWFHCVSSDPHSKDHRLVNRNDTLLRDPATRQPEP
jgi:hypothetical protein